jgi:hypothetical protein
MIMGPLLDAWNFVRRPLPQVAMTVVEPFDAGLSSKTPTLSLSRGGSVTLELEAKNLPQDAEIHLKELPEGVSFAVTGRQENQITLRLEATPAASLGKYEFSAEARVGDRWAPTGPIQLAVEQQPEEVSAGR